jgi:CO dehydrogenase maturation factor
MGLYHCLLGVPYYDCEGCIDCGMCIATSKEEMIAASKKVRDYLKTHAKNSGPVKKIAICGKGGAGKSTVAALLAAALGQENFSVIVFDTDESNPGLSRMFGIEIQPEPLMNLFSRFSAAPLDPANAWLKNDSVSINDIPSEYIACNNNIKFLIVGKIEEAFQGCACTIAGIAADLAARLSLTEKEIVLIDMEAGVESFGRGVERSADTVLAIVEPSFQSIELAKKINYMAAGMGISRVRVMLNKVISHDTEEKMTEELVNKNIGVIGKINFYNSISEAGFEGKICTDSKAMDDIRTVVKKLFEK